VRDEIVELDEHPIERPPRRAERFVVGALLSGSLVFSFVAAFAASFQQWSADTRSAPSIVPTSSPLMTPVPFTTPGLRIQPPLFRPGSPLPRITIVPLPLPNDAWRYGATP
jgi:hypothetical protein